MERERKGETHTQREREREADERKTLAFFFFNWFKSFDTILIRLATREAIMKQISLPRLEELRIMFLDGFGRQPIADTLMHHV